MVKRILSLAQVKQEHKIECQEVSLEFFIEHYCKNLLAKEKQLTTVEVVVSPRFSFVFEK